MWGSLMAPECDQFLWQLLSLNVEDLGEVGTTLKFEGYCCNICSPIGMRDLFAPPLSTFLTNKLILHLLSRDMELSELLLFNIIFL